MNAPHPHSTVERHLLPPPPPIPPAPFETERFLVVQAAHAWRATRPPRRTRQQWEDIGLAVLLTVSGLCTLALVWGMR